MKTEATRFPYGLDIRYEKKKRETSGGFKVFGLNNMNNKVAFYCGEEDNRTS